MDLNTSLALQGISFAPERQTLFPNDGGVCGGVMEMGRGGGGKPFSARPSSSDQNNNNNPLGPTARVFPGSGSRSVFHIFEKYSE